MKIDRQTDKGYQGLDSMGGGSLTVALTRMTISQILMEAYHEAK